MTDKTQRGYVVLERIDGDEIDATVWRPIFNETAAQGRDGHVRVFEVATQEAAVAEYTGSGDDMIEGTFKAVALSSWRGEITRRKQVRSVSEKTDEFGA